MNQSEGAAEVENQPKVDIQTCQCCQTAEKTIALCGKKEMRSLMQWDNGNIIQNIAEKMAVAERTGVVSAEGSWMDKKLLHCQTVGRGEIHQLGSFNRRSS